MKKLLAAFVAVILLNSSVAFAETKIYEGVGEYFMTEETVDFAKQEAEKDAARVILEQACAFIKAQATMLDHELDEDEIIKICAGVLYWNDSTKYSIDAEADGVTVKAFVSAKIDTDEVDALLEQAIKAHDAKR